MNTYAGICGTISQNNEEKTKAQYQVEYLKYAKDIIQYAAAFDGDDDDDILLLPICDMMLLVRNRLIRRQLVFRHSRPHN